MRKLLIALATLALPTLVYAGASGPRATPDLWEAPDNCVMRPELGRGFHAAHPKYCVGSTWNGMPVYVAPDQAPGAPATPTFYVINPPLAKFGDGVIPGQRACQHPDWKSVPVPSESTMWRQDTNYYAMPYDVRFQVAGRRAGKC